MDLIPKPDQVVSAAGNILQLLTAGNVADLRPMPRTLVDEGERRRVHRYDPADGVPAQGDPVLLVAPLAAPALCYDLRRGCSLVEHLVGQGRPTYLVEYGEVSFRDRALEIGPWVDEVVPAAIRTVSRRSRRRRVHVVGWSLGGTFAMLAAAADPTLPIRSLTVLGTPFDLSDVPLVAPLRPLLEPPAIIGSQPLVQWAVQLSAFQRLVAKPLALAAHLDDEEYLAQIEAVDHLTASSTAYPRRTYGQVYHRLLQGLGDHTAALAEVTAPVLVLAGSEDTIAPLSAVRALVPLLPGALEVRLEIVPGGHLGMLTGRRARTGTWPVLDEWFSGRR